MIEPQLPAFMGYVFEDICKQFLDEIYKELPFYYTKIGRWWGNNPAKKQEEEIDILAFHQDQAIFGECNWWEQAIKPSVLTDLQDQAKLFHFQEAYFFLFAKKAFTPEVEKLCELDNHIHLYTLETICTIVSKLHQT